MDQTGEENCVKDFILEKSSEEVIAGMDSSEIKANITSEKRVQNIKNKAGKEKLKTLNAKAMTVDLLPERKIKKRKAVCPPTSGKVVDSIKTLKTLIVSSFQNIKTLVKEKCVIYMTVIQNNFLRRGVNVGILEKINEANAEEKSKIKKTESIKNDSQNLNQKEAIEKPLISEITIKNLKKQICTSFGNIRKRMSEMYSIRRNVLKSCVANYELDAADAEKKFDKFCQTGYYNGVHQKIDGIDVEEESKMKKPENIEKDSRNLCQKEGKVKPEKKTAVTKKHSNLFVVFVVIFLLLFVKANLVHATPSKRQNLKLSQDLGTA